MDASDFGDGGRATDRRHAASIEIAKGLARLRIDGAPDVVRHGFTLLNRDRSETRQQFAITLAESGEVPRDKDLGMAWQAQVRLYGYPHGSVQLNAELMSQG